MPVSRYRQLDIGYNGTSHTSTRGATEIRVPETNCNMARFKEHRRLKMTVICFVREAVTPADISRVMMCGGVCDQEKSRPASYK